MNATMALSGLDWGVIIAYLLVSVGIGLYFIKRASGSMADYFVAGRNVTWWLAGISMVATTFAADTPLVIARIVRTQGIQGNWYWWASAIGATLCVYFFARLWRRSRLITDAEFMELRYAGKPAVFLRAFYAFFRSVFCNSIVLGWVILAMYKIVYTLLGWPKVASTWALVFISVIYIFSSGLWGVLATDFFQFFLAMTGCIILAGIVLIDAGGPAALVAKATAACAADKTGALVAPSQLIGFFPDAHSSSLAVLTFLIFITMQWWQSSQGDGFMAQRLFSCKNEKHSLLAMLFYSFLHYAVRPWPWIIVGIGSLIYFPNLADPETAYPMMMIKFLPNGLRGMLVAAFLAAFMSTVVTHINLGASYLVNDIYKRFIKPDESDKHYVWVSRFSIVAITLLAGCVCLLMKSVYSAWLLGTALMAGPAVIVLLRWYWWRINAWSEITALLSAVVLTIASLNIGFLGGEDYYPIRLVLIILLSTGFAILATFLTKPEPQEQLEKFYSRVRPGGWWKPVSERLPEISPVRVGKPEFLNWAATFVCVYSALFAIGWFCLGRWQAGAAATAVCAALLAFILKRIDSMNWA